MSIATFPGIVQITHNKDSRNIIKEIANRDVNFALAEDLRTGDIASNFPELNEVVRARIDTRVDFVLAGIPWAEATLSAICQDSHWECSWLGKDGDSFTAGSTIAVITAVGSKLLAAERTMLNFLQLLSGVATTAKKLVSLAGEVPVYDTRKTIPNLRKAQRYATKVAGMKNNRAGLFDAVIIKENHITIAGSISTIVTSALKYVDIDNIQVEVTNMQQLEEAINLNVKNIMLDNWSVADTKKAVKINNKRAVLESTGSINESNIKEYASTGVDRISCGIVTRNPAPIDLTLLLDE